MTALDFQNELCSLQRDLNLWALKFTRNSEDAKDLTQEVMVKALSNQEKFNPGTNFKSWLYTILRNTFLNQQYKAKRYVSNGDDIVFSDRSNYGSYEMSSVETQEIEGRIAALNVEVKQPFIMTMDGYSYQEISEEMDIPMGTVKSRIFKARKTLMEDLQERGYEDRLKR